MQLESAKELGNLTKYCSKQYKGEKVTKVVFGRLIRKQIDRLPDSIAEKFLVWVAEVEANGIRRLRLTKGLHDEPLKGKRFGQRSVWLNRAYRIIYRESVLGIIEVLEVNKHEY
jgi:proteic killer suppression protein